MSGTSLISAVCLRFIMSLCSGIWTSGPHSLKCGFNSKCSDKKKYEREQQTNRALKSTLQRFDSVCLSWLSPSVVAAAERFRSLKVTRPPTGHAHIWASGSCLYSKRERSTRETGHFWLYCSSVGNHMTFFYQNNSLIIYTSTSHLPPSLIWKCFCFEIITANDSFLISL